MLDGDLAKLNRDWGGSAWGGVEESEGECKREDVEPHGGRFWRLEQIDEDER